MSLKGKRKPKLNRTHTDSANSSAFSWDELYRIYHRSKQSEGLAESTLHFRDKFHRYFMEFLALKYPDMKPHEVTTDVLRDWIAYMKNERTLYEGNNRIPDRMKTVGLSPGTINTYLRNTKIFFNFMEAEGYITDSPFKRLKFVKEERDTVQSFTEDQVRALLKEPDKRSYNGFRDYVIMLLLLDTGCRIVELVNLRIEDVNTVDCTIYIRAANAKSNVGRFVPFSNTTRKELRNLIAEVRELNSEYLFTTVYGNKMEPGRIRSAIKKYGKDAQITGIRVSPHTFRHTFAKFYILNGGDPFTLQKLLGHSDMAMVRRYIQMNDIDIRRQHDRFSPLTNVLTNKK